MSNRPVEEITIKRFDHLRAGDRYQHYLWAVDENGGAMLSGVRVVERVSRAWGVSIVSGERDEGIEFTETFPHWHKVILVLEEEMRCATPVK